MRTQAVVVAGLGFGDEGKGTTVESIVHRTGSKLVVRYNGGAQAEHNVVMRDGRHHTFSQFGAGTLRRAATFLSASVLIEPLAMVAESMHLERLGVAAPFESLFIDGDAPVITPYHRAANLVDERARGLGAHGSTGMGIGRTREYSLRWPDDTLRARDLNDEAVTRAKLSLIRARLEAQLPAPFPRNFASVKETAREFQVIASRMQVVRSEWLGESMRAGGVVVFEGAQGVLLDQDWGFQPHTTWSDTTFGEANKLLAELDCETIRVGVVRAYTTRHGAGPLPTEGLLELSEPHNRGGFAGGFRTGAMDLQLFQYAIKAIGGVDELAVTHLDRRTSWPVCTSWGRAFAGFSSPTFEGQTELADELRRLDQERFRVETAWSGPELLEYLEAIAKARATCRSHGPTAEDKVWADTAVRIRGK